MFEIVFYARRSGYCPIKEFILNINDLKLQTKVLRDLELLEKYGKDIDYSYSNKIKYSKSNIFELRTKQSTNISRIFDFFTRKKQIILLNSFIKKVQKTLRAEILLALKYQKDWEDRQNG